MSSRWIDDIKTLSEWLGSLQITHKASTDDEWTDTEISVAPALIVVTSQENVQTGLPKNMVLDPGWFDGDQIKFEDW